MFASTVRCPIFPGTAGADEAYLTMSETGVALASHLMDRTPAKPSLIVGKSV